MLFSKTLLTFTAILGAALQAHAHAAVSPVLGVSGTAARSDVQRPSNQKPCGKMDVASAFDSSDAIPVASDGTFTAMITNFNKGVDGSRQVAQVMVDPKGTGDKSSFVAATMVANGTKSPKSVDSEQLTVQLPAGMSCSGTGGKCLVSFKTAGGFGNCVVVQQSADGAAAAAGGSGKAAAGRRRAFRFARVPVA
ncbi:uncharacterized protein BXZ73DRAFT_51960 [Epithele typhae]|uniref:uncharacterized protein n=1 Tax=Epithele typhae TaxID=378194 RepID=UPI002007F13F|nr:uncharacterized protein BXZ73DRAFT_51960 [Epithele typhae]KAH9921249.1 hypothetical protein BXZ73DRAFT_51960 [Epithele typhae]